MKLHASLVLNVTHWAIYEPRRDTCAVDVARVSTTERATGSRNWQYVYEDFIDSLNIINEQVEMKTQIKKRVNETLLTFYWLLLDVS